MQIKIFAAISKPLPLFLLFFLPQSHIFCALYIKEIYIHTIIKLKIRYVSLITKMYYTVIYYYIGTTFTNSTILKYYCELTYSRWGVSSHSEKYLMNEGIVNESSIRCRILENLERSLEHLIAYGLQCRCSRLPTENSFRWRSREVATEAATVCTCISSRMHIAHHQRLFEETARAYACFQAIPLDAQLIQSGYNFV